MQKLMKAMHKNEKGFTLVELMVVVVIIGVLVAIAIPIFQNVTRGANRGAIEANLRTIDGVIMMYFADTGDYPTVHTDVASDYIQTWPDGEPDASITYDLYGAASGTRAVVIKVGSTSDVTGHDPALEAVASGTNLDALPWR